MGTPPPDPSYNIFIVPKCLLAIQKNLCNYPTHAIMKLLSEGGFKELVSPFFHERNFTEILQYLKSAVTKSVCKHVKISVTVPRRFYVKMGCLY